MGHATPNDSASPKSGSMWRSTGMGMIVALLAVSLFGILSGAF